MDISIGSKIYLKRDFVNKIAADDKTSLDFQVVAMTDVAIGIRNLRTKRNYTLSIDSVVDNIDNKRKTGIMPKGRITVRPEVAPTEPEPTTGDVEDESSTETFTHEVDQPTGGIDIKESDTNSTVESSDDPFSGLYT